jgi:conjugative transfer region lipoprotein (TIGR03751 family)
MVSNDFFANRRFLRGFSSITVLACAITVVTGCSVSGKRESPINEITRDSPTVVDIYRGKVGNASSPDSRANEPQQRLRTASQTRSIAADDGNTRRYWSALEPMQQRFARVPNPDLVMVVYPHLAQGKYPVPGYVTVFPMYEQTVYALPGEVSEDLIEGRAMYQGKNPPAKQQRADAEKD